MLKYLWVGIIVLLSNILEAVTGFGATVVALPFLTGIIGVKTSVIVLCMITWVLSITVCIMNFRKIDWRAYLNIIGFTIIGMPVGMLAFSYLPEKTLKIALGIFIIFSAIRGLYILLKKNGESKKPNEVLLRILLFIGGIVHGAFASGGPFLIIYAGEKIKEKTSFRATMCAVWLTLNTILMAKYYFTDSLDLPTVLPYFGAALPFLALGFLIGILLHKKVSQKTFSIIVYIVLLIAGATMLVTAIVK